MTKHVRRLGSHAVRVTIAAGVAAMGLGAGVTHAVAADEWTNGNPAMASDWSPELPTSAQPDPTTTTTAPADDWSNANPASGADWQVPQAADDWSNANGASAADDS
jgi:hypothetical protein